MTTFNSNRRTATRLALVATATLCGFGAMAAADSPTDLPSPRPPMPDVDSFRIPAPSQDDWVADLDWLDQVVRAHYADPFTNLPEVEWTAALAGLAASLPVASPADADAAINELIVRLVGGSAITLPNSAIVVYLPDSLAAAADSGDLPMPIPCAPRPASCPV